MRVIRRNFSTPTILEFQCLMTRNIQMTQEMGTLSRRKPWQCCTWCMWGCEKWGSCCVKKIVLWRTVNIGDLRRRNLPVCLNICSGIQAVTVGPKWHSQYITIQTHSFKTWMACDAARIRGSNSSGTLPTTKTIYFSFHCRAIRARAPF